MPSQGFLFGQYLATVGVELESEALNRAVVQDALTTRLSKYYDQFPLTVTRDASTESNIEVTSVRGAKNRNIEIYTHNKIFNKIARRNNTSAYGYELVINPIEITDLEPLLHRVINTLVSLGDFTTNRSSVHFHVGFAHNLRIMKKLLAVCLKIDPLLYRLGGMGGYFRGHANLAAYARPIMNAPAVPISGEIRVRPGNALPRVQDPDLARLLRNQQEQESEQESRRDSVRGFVQIINPLKALEAKTTDEFWACWGVFPSLLGLNKYHPARYVGCNFYSLTQHGTMEFRHFNQSQDSTLIYIIAKFLRALVDVATELTKTEIAEFSPENSNEQISMDDAEECMYLLEKFWKIHDTENAPSDSEIRLLMETIEKSTFIALPETPVLTHNREFTIPSNLIGGLNRLSKKPLNPANTDIHTIKYSTILGDYK